MPDISTNPALDFLEPLFRDSAWPQVALVLRLIFLVLAIRLLIQSSRGGAWKFPGKGNRRMPRFFGVLTLAAFLLIAGRQAVWQLFGRRNPEFVAFMQRFDRREFNPAHRARAGKILDRQGRVLAVSRVTDHGIRRFYPNGPVFSHVVGYNHPLYGLTGLEAAARPHLLGREFRSREELLALGAELLDRETYAEGPALFTTLDLALQRRAHDLLGDRDGAVVVMDVDTGDILAMVSKPEFDPNRLYEGLFNGRAPNAPLLNRALLGRYPPGSVFKVLVAAAALQDGFQDRFDTPPQGFTTSPANPPIRDHEFYTARTGGGIWRGRGRIGLGQALVHSSNVFFAQLGIATGAEDLLRAIRAAGLGESLDLWSRDESTLTLPPARFPDLRDERPYEIAQFSIGQGDLLLSPLHIAMVSAAVANGGLAVHPRLDPESAVRPLGRLCGPEQAETLKWMMYKVVQEGTGRGIRMPELAVAGKTGTAQTGVGRASHSWFTGFAPVSKPQWAFCVLVEHGGYGSSAALPIARDLLKTAVEQGALRP